MLDSIYGEEAFTVDGESQLRILIPGPEPSQPGDAPSSRRLLYLHCALPESYPSADPPLFELHSEWLPYGVLDSLTSELESRFSPGEGRPPARRPCCRRGDRRERSPQPCRPAGEVVLFEWVELLRERWAEALAQAAADDALREEAAADGAAALAAAAAEQLSLGEAAAAAQAHRAPASAEEEALQAAIAEVSERIVHGEPFVAKRSTFQAHLAPATRVAHVHAVMEILMRSNKIRAASHNMMAYRIAAAEGSFLQVRRDGCLLLLFVFGRVDGGGSRPLCLELRAGRVHGACHCLACAWP